MWHRHVNKVLSCLILSIPVRGLNADRNTAVMFLGNTLNSIIYIAEVIVWPGPGDLGHCTSDSVNFVFVDFVFAISRFSKKFFVKS